MGNPQARRIAMQYAKSASRWVHIRDGMYQYHSRDGWHIVKDEWDKGAAFSLTLHFPEGVDREIALGQSFSRIPENRLDEAAREMLGEVKRIPFLRGIWGEVESVLNATVRGLK